MEKIQASPEMMNRQDRVKSPLRLALEDLAVGEAIEVSIAAAGNVVTLRTRVCGYAKTLSRKFSVSRRDDGFTVARIA